MTIQRISRFGQLRAHRPGSVPAARAPVPRPVLVSDYRAYGPVVHGDLPELWITAKTAYACLSDARGDDMSHRWLSSTVHERAQSMAGMSDAEAAACAATMRVIEQNAAHNPAVARLARAVADACLVSRERG